jgi:hypothetical protein
MRLMPGAAILLALSAVALGLSACAPVSAQPRDLGPFLVRTRTQAVPVSVLTGAADTVAAVAARDLFSSAPVVVITSPARLAAAGRDAVRVHAPVFVTSKSGGGRLRISRPVRAEIKSLKPKAALALGVKAALVASALPGVQVVTTLRQLPRTKAPVPLTKVVLLAHRGESSADAPAATARAAGARVLVLPGSYDPRTDPAVIRKLAAFKPTRVLAVGKKFGPGWRLGDRVAVAATGVQLPGGGQVLFPMHRLVCLYGDPLSPSLGALGEQDLTASVARVKQLAELYRPLSKVPVIPAFEIIATVAQGVSEPEGGTYSYVTPEDQIQPWVEQARAAGLYVVLDLQPGRASLLDQAKDYQKLLQLPDVGLAIDPEWKLGPTELPLRQIGSVSSTEVNSVISWLAKLTARHHLPQKLLVLHQFRLSMLEDEPAIDTSHDDLAIVIHMDGQGTPGEKQATWDAVLGAAPHGVFFGWKNFFVKDHPMMDPQETMARTPQPVMISYQ